MSKQIVFFTLFITLTNGQLFRPFNALFQRYQNVACTGDARESGTCIPSDDCHQRGGISSGQCQGVST